MARGRSHRSGENGCALILLIGLLVFAVSRCSENSSTVRGPPENVTSGPLSGGSRSQYVAVSTLNCRAEASRRASRIKRLSSGDLVLVEETRGAWSRVTASGDTCWVVASSLADAPPSTLRAPSGATSRAPAGMGTDTDPPRRRSRSGSSLQCGSKRVCGEMNSCAEANYYLNQCGLSRLDGDGDGVPCESICG